MWRHLDWMISVLSRFEPELHQIVIINKRDKLLAALARAEQAGKLADATFEVRSEGDHVALVCRRGAHLNPELGEGFEIQTCDKLLAALARAKDSVEFQLAVFLMRAERYH